MNPDAVNLLLVGAALAELGQPVMVVVPSFVVLIEAPDPDEELET